MALNSLIPCWRVATLLDPSLLHPDRFGGPKFVLCVGCGFVNAILLALGLITSNEYEFLIMGTVGAFIGGEAAATVFKKPDDKRAN